MKQIKLINKPEDESIIEAIWFELQRAEEKFPSWPDDIVHGAAIVAEEAGEIVKAALDLYYGRGNIIHLIKETRQTAAMAVRLLIYLARKAER